MLIYTADHVIPIRSRPIRDGAVAVDAGRIAAVGPRDAVLAEVGAASPTRALGCTVLIPGLINAHCHLELSWMAGDPPPGGDYTDWVRGLLARREGEDPVRARKAAEREIGAMLVRGVVAVGDVGNATWVAPLLARSGLHGVFFHEVLGLRGSAAEEILRQAVDRMEELHSDPAMTAAAGRLRAVLTPHAPHTTSVALLRALAGRAAAAGQPLSIHLAESREEAALLADGTGSLAGLFREREFWDDDWEPPELSPVQHVDRLGLLEPHTLAVHCVDLSQDDHSKLQSRGATVVTCARSNERIGVGRAPIPKLLSEGISVAVGTDSLASSPDLDVLAEMQALCRIHESLSPAAVLRMATLNGAVALGLGTELGSLEPGKLASLVAVPLEDPDADPLRTVCGNPREVQLLDGTSES